MTRVVSFSRRYRFSASHRLHVDHLTDEQNRECFGKCNNPHGHGHNYILEVRVKGPVSDETGMVVNLVDLDAVVKQRVIDRFDLQNLNHDPLFATEVSSTENLCKEVWQLLQENEAPQRLGSARLERVRLEETENNFFEFAGKEN